MIATELFRNEENFETFAAGETIFKDGDEGHVMYVLYEGRVRLLVHDRLMAKLVAGDVFGEMALVDDAPRSATAVAETAVKLVAISEKRFDQLVQKTPKFARQIMQVMAERLRNMGNKLRAP